MYRSLSKNIFATIFRCASFLLSFGVHIIAAAAYQYPFHAERHVYGSAVIVSLKNEGLLPVSAIVRLDVALNTAFSPLPFGDKIIHFLAPGETKNITTAVTLNKKMPARFAYTVTYSIGEPGSIHKSGTIYRLPIADNDTCVVRTATSPKVKDNFIDTNTAYEILIKKGSSVVASRNGTVFNTHGSPDDPDNKEPSAIGNFVSILHDDGTWATYAWLADESLLVKPGD